MQTFKQFVELIQEGIKINPSSVVQKRSRFFFDKDQVNKKLAIGDIVSFEFKGFPVKGKIVAMRGPNNTYEVEPLRK